MEFTKSLIKGKLIKRYKRFFTDVKLSKEIVTAHCPNTGSMKGLLNEGNEVHGGFEHSGLFALVDKQGYIRSRNDEFGNPIKYYRAVESFHPHLVVLNELPYMYTVRS